MMKTRKKKCCVAEQAGLSPKSVILKNGKKYYRNSAL
jgi:hypothetical protein